MEVCCITLAALQYAKQICLYLNQDGPVNCERYFGWANAFIIVYSIDNRNSFEACQQYMQTVTLYSKGLQPEAPVIILGNKVDMERYRWIKLQISVNIAIITCMKKMKICREFTHPQAIQNVDELVSSSEQIWRNLAFYHFLTNGSSAVNGCRQNESPNSW